MSAKKKTEDQQGEPAPVGHWDGFNPPPESVVAELFYLIGALRGQDFDLHKAIDAGLSVLRYMNDMAHHGGQPQVFGGGGSFALACEPDGSCPEAADKLEALCGADKGEPQTVGADAGTAQQIIMLLLPVVFKWIEKRLNK